MSSFVWGLLGAVIGAAILALVWGVIGSAIWGPEGGVVFGFIWGVVGGIVGGVGSYGLCRDLEDRRRKFNEMALGWLSES
jgi:uncharacterized ion transporter superfamily protein YfcC